MKFLNTLTLLAFAFMGSNAMKEIPSKELLKDIKIGWNLGNALDAHCLDTLDYDQDQLASETCWSNPKATQGLFDKLNGLGFNIFRIPTTWSGHFGDAPDYKISDVWMKRVHEVVDEALKTGSYAILNIHHETWNHAFQKNLESGKVILEALWKQIAAEFADYDEHLIFEGMNEPRKVDDPNEWNGGDQEGWDFVNEMNTVFLKTIRATGGNNAIRHLMIPSYAASVNDEPLEAYVSNFPMNDDKVIASVHAYVPYNFALNTGEGAEANFTSTNDVDWAMNNIKKHLLERNIPVIIGEFGAMNRENELERAKWAEYYVNSATSMGVPCVLWDNGYFQGDGELFGIIDRSTYEVAYPELVNGLMRGLGDKNTSTGNVDNAIDNTANSGAAPTRECWTEKLGFPCCQKTSQVEYADEDGRWGVEDGHWCGLN
eukprot:jgi/Orpsp1_1/1187549/evm.model.d7180000058515.1